MCLQLCREVLNFKQSAFNCLAASGDVQAYQIRTAPASTIAPSVVMASSPALPTQGATEEVTRKREVRLMKNRYVLPLLSRFFSCVTQNLLGHQS